jgi:hypothetical protein
MMRRAHRHLIFTTRFCVCVSFIIARGKSTTAWGRRRMRTPTSQCNRWVLVVFNHALTWIILLLSSSQFHWFFKSYCLWLSCSRLSKVRVPLTLGLWLLKFLLLIRLSRALLLNLSIWSLMLCLFMYYYWSIYSAFRGILNVWLEVRYKTYYM